MACVSARSRMRPVAPLAGSVDRNLPLIRTSQKFRESLPSRGAWIEILAYEYKLTDAVVAPLAGSVDRNSCAVNLIASAIGSLPSRGAWIEICGRRPYAGRRYVAPLAGSVDRNYLCASRTHRNPRRSPRGERG